MVRAADSTRYLVWTLAWRGNDCRACPSTHSYDETQDTVHRAGFCANLGSSTFFLDDPLLLEQGR